MPTAQAMLRTCPRRPNQPRLALSLNRGHNLAAVKVPSPFGERKNAGDDFSGANPVSADRVRDEPGDSTVFTCRGPSRRRSSVGLLASRKDACILVGNRRMAASERGDAR